MFINELAEPTLLVIYPGRFQPFHKGHYAVYEHLTGKFGRNNVYIATSNKVDGERSPFAFSEKSYFMQLTGVPADRIVQASQPYQIQNVLQSGQIQVADPANTVVIFAVSEKDMAEDPRFSFAPKKDGTDPYFQPLKNIKDTVAMDQHGYVMTVPTFDFNVLGQPMRSGTELRKMYVEADEKTRQAIIADLFGKYTREAEQLMTSKLAPNVPVAPTRPTKLPKTVKPVGGQVVEPVSEDSAGTPAVDSKRYALLTKARIAHPVAKSDVEALALYINDKEERDVDHLDQVNDREDDMIDHLEKLEMDLQAQISNLQHKFDSEKVKEETREPYQQSIDRLETSRIEQLNSLMDEIRQRITTEKLPPQYVEALKQRLLKLKAERDSYYGVR